MVALAALLCVRGASALYTASDKDVLQVGEKDFNTVVVKGAGLHLVEFYAPVRLAPSTGPGATQST